jgi:hypothetical protein
MSQRDIDLSWAAGIFEGEGCAGFYLRKRPSKKLKEQVLVIQVGQSESGKDMLDALVQILGGGSICPKKSRPGTQQAYRWQICGDAAAEIIDLVMPYMRVNYKRIQFAQAAAAWRERWSEEMQARRVQP